MTADTVSLTALIPLDSSAPASLLDDLDDAEALVSLGGDILDDGLLRDLADMRHEPRTLLDVAARRPREDDIDGRLRDALRDVEPDLHAVLEPRLRARFAAELVDGVRKRATFRRELQLAKDAGHPDPVMVARNATLWAVLMARYEQRIEHIFRRAKSRSLDSANRRLLHTERAAKSARPDLRRLPHKDRVYVLLLAKAERQGWFGDQPLVASRLKSKLKAYTPPHWDKTTTSLKVLAYALESHARGASTFSLRLGREVAKKALASKRGPAAFLQNRIRQAMKREFGDDAPDFWFTIEDGYSPEKLHLHGAIVLPSSPEVVDRASGALRRAGGKWATTQGQQYQLALKVMDKPFGWAGYVCKELNITARDVEQRLVAVTSGLARAARERWPETRAALPRV